MPIKKENLDLRKLRLYLIDLMLTEEEGRLDLKRRMGWDDLSELRKLWFVIIFCLENNSYDMTNYDYIYEKSYKLFELIWIDKLQ